MASTAPTWLAPAFRYAGDDWQYANALEYIVYLTPPVYASDGVTIVTPGVPQPLTNCSVAGFLRYQTRRVPGLLPGPAPEPARAAATISMIGAIVDPVNGIISLSLPAAQTVFPRQSLDLWSDPRRALLIAQPKVVDAGGNATTIGLQPLFVF